MEKRVNYTEKEYKWELKSKKDRLFVQTTVFYLNIVMLFDLRSWYGHRLSNKAPINCIMSKKILHSKCTCLGGFSSQTHQFEFVGTGLAKVTTSYCGRFNTCLEKYNIYCSKSFQNLYSDLRSPLVWIQTCAQDQYGKYCNLSRSNELICCS